MGDLLRCALCCRYSDHVFSDAPIVDELMSDSQQGTDSSGKPHRRKQRIKKLAGTTLALGTMYLSGTEAIHQNVGDQKPPPRFAPAPEDEEDEVSHQLLHSRYLPHLTVSAHLQHWSEQSMLQCGAVPFRVSSPACTCAGHKPAAQAAACTKQLFLGVAIGLHPWLPMVCDRQSIWRF